MRIAVLHGPNLNLLGTREPELYGSTTLADINTELQRLGGELGVEVETGQWNGEGELVSAIQGLRGRADGALINAGAYTHTSLAIRDAFAAVQVPFVEVHLTNIYAREPERRHSMLAAGARATIGGFGAFSYSLALRGLVHSLRDT